MAEREVEEAWVNLEDSARRNALRPDANPASPGRPCFVGTETATVGQWVRLVFRLDNGSTFWAVGTLAEVVSARAVRVSGIGYDSGDMPPPWFAASPWSARVELDDRGVWYVTELEEEGEDEE